MATQELGRAPGRGRQGMNWVRYLAIAWVALWGGVMLGQYNNTMQKLVKTMENDVRVAWRGDVERRKGLHREQWVPLRSDLPTGVSIFREDEVFPGYTLYMNSGLNAKLIDIDGNVIHEWSMEGKLDQLQHDFPNPDLAYFRSAHLFSDGRLVVQMAQLGRTPWGAATIMLDKDSNVVWEHNANTHHNVTVDEAKGLVYVLTHSPDKDWRPPAGFPRKQNILRDSLEVLDLEGRLLDSISINDALKNSQYWWMYKYSASDWDLLHTNDVELVTDAFRKKIPSVPTHAVLISLRNIDAVAILDLDLRQIVWLISGPWKAQHDPDILPNGNLMIYDNRSLQNERKSRLVEIDPVRGEVVWTYTGSFAHPFFSVIRGSQQLLANGNFLVTEPDEGRVFEINRSGDLVWQFVNPDIHPEWPDQHRALTKAERFPVSDLTFLGNK